MLLYILDRFVRKMGISEMNCLISVFILLSMVLIISTIRIHAFDYIKLNQ